MSEGLDVEGTSEGVDVEGTSVKLGLITTAHERLLLCVEERVSWKVW